MSASNLAVTVTLNSSLVVVWDQLYSPTCTTTNVVLQLMVVIWVTHTYDHKHCRMFADCTYIGASFNLVHSYLVYK